MTKGNINPCFYYAMGYFRKMEEIPFDLFVSAIKPCDITNGKCKQSPDWRSCLYGYILINHRRIQKHNEKAFNHEKIG